MAGFIFSIDGNSGIEGLKKCVYDGDYAALVPLDLNILAAKQVAASVLADYCSMKAGDNVYFLSKRCIYGVGRLVNIQGDCKYKNYLNAHRFERIDELEEGELPLKINNPCARWICFFEPEHENGFFSRGVDMDDVLLYKPASFRMLRAFQDRSFIKIDDEENNALKEMLYLRNKNNLDYFPYSEEEHERVNTYELNNYRIKPEETLLNQSNNGEAGLEMLVEASLVDSIQRIGFEGEGYDYVSHQVIASPFKPLSYIDKIDIMAYRFLEKYPDARKPIEQYLVLELKKGKTNADTIRQLMRYVDWISKEYAAGDYSLIRAGVVAKDYTQRDIQKVLETECQRSYISSTHPNVTTIWNEAKLFTYYIDCAGLLKLKPYNPFDVEKHLQEKLESFGWKISKSDIIVDGERYSSKYKVTKKKVAFFDKKDDASLKLENKGWKCFAISELKDKNDVDELIKHILE